MSEATVPTVNQPTMMDIVPANHPLAMFLNPGPFAQLQRAAKMFSASDIVPKAYQGKEANCAVAIEMAARMNINPFAVMQNIAVINGRPSMEAKLLIALINQSPKFSGELEFEVDGAKGPSSDGTWKKGQGQGIGEPVDPTYRVRAYATRSETGKVLYGPWIGWNMVMAEKWHSKDGSKWLTMPEIMFMYRSASFFGKLYAPDITMGLQSTEEAYDANIVDITPTRAVANPRAELEAMAAEVAAQSVAPPPDKPKPAKKADKVEPAPEPESFISDTTQVDPETGELAFDAAELCPECNSPLINGGCRSVTCPEGRPE